jgi:hypothetical protein
VALQQTHITMCGLTSRKDGMLCVVNALNEITLFFTLATFRLKWT